MTAEITNESIELFKSPAVWLIPNFLTDEECSHLVNLANDKLYRSEVLDNESGQSLVNEFRSSWQTHLAIGHDPIVADIERRLAQHVNLPVEHGEGMQIIRYEIGQEFKPHHDYFDPDCPGFAGTLKGGGQRRTTVLIYLSEPEAGGETLFPAINLRVKPTKGHALVFNNLRNDGSLDVNSLHGSIPVSAGEKWVATKWVRVNAIS
jgi:prolyl 4-hydroxylase